MLGLLADQYSGISSELNSFKVIDKTKWNNNMLGIDRTSTLTHMLMFNNGGRYVLASYEPGKKTERT